MSAFPGPNNPIVYAQFRLQGGWRGVAIMAGVLVAVLGAILALQGTAAAANGGSVSTVIADWPQGLVLLQVLFLLIIGPLRVANAIRGDVNNRMIESHRLMPLGPGAAVAGYIVGGPWAAWVLGAVTLLFGTACCVLGGVDPLNYLLANGVLLAAALLLCVTTAHLSMVHRLGVMLLLVLIPVGMSGSNGPAELLPACSVLAAPLISHSALVLRGSDFAVDAWGLALIGQAAIAAICFRAAVRLYRTPGCIGLSPSLGLLLLAVWVALSALGTSHSATFTSPRRYGRPIDPALQIAASLTAGLLVAALPVAAAAKTAARRGATPGQRLAPLLVLATAIAFVMAMPAVTLLAWPAKEQPIVPQDQRATAMGVTLGVVGASLVGLACLFGSAYRRVGRAWLITLIWLLVTWIAPLMVDAATNIDQHGFGPVGSVSPIGALSIAWIRTGQTFSPPPVSGVIAQWAIAAVAGAMMLLAAASRRRRDGRSDQGRVDGRIQPGESGSKIVGTRGDQGLAVEAGLGVDA